MSGNEAGRPAVTFPGQGPLVTRAEADPEVRDMLEDPSVSNSAAARALGVDESSVRRWRSRHRQHQERVDAAAGRPIETSTVPLASFNSADRVRLHARLDAVLDEITGHGEVKGMTVRRWEGFMRGTDGQPQVVQLQGIKLDVKVNQIAPDWPMIDRPSVTLKVIPPGEPRPSRSRDRVAVLLPDPQIGYRLFESGELDPFHDEMAIDVAMQVASDLRPDRLISLGDFQDFAEFGRFTQETSFVRTTQRGIDRGHQFVGQMRQACPDGELDIMEGNHDRRAEKRILETNMAAWGLRRAADTTGWPVFSVPYLCAFDVFECRYVGGYPAGELWITDELRCIHGIKVRSSSSTAAAVVKDDGVSTIFGHVHRIETQYLSTRVRGGHRTRLAHTPGCLCRIDGSVPSAKSSTSLDGRPVPSAENWQNGLSVVEYRDGRPAFALHSVFIDTANGYEARFNGKTYVPRLRPSR